LAVLIVLFAVVIDRNDPWHAAYVPFMFVGYKHFLTLAMGVGLLSALAELDRRW